MYFASKYIDQIYHFKGAWDVPSFCGLKIIYKADKTIIIATELYESNPGSSVTEWVDKLATELIRNFNVDPKNLVFIEHLSDRESSLEFYKETFDLVNFEWDGKKLFQPVWHRITQDDFDRLIA